MVTAVALGYQNGLVVWGPGGTSKSFTVLGTLVALNANYKLFNARMTGRGLYDCLKASPAAVHVLEDMEHIMRDPMAQGVLRAALLGQRPDGGGGPQERLVTWTTHGTQDSFAFTGGIIIVSNRDVPHLPEWQAIGTRIPTLHIQPTEDEIRALMRHVAGQGYEHGGLKVSPADCKEVCEHVIEQARALNYPLDMRLLVHALNAYLQWQEGDAACDWKDLVAARLARRPVAPGSAVSSLSRADRKRQEQDIVREIIETTASPARRLQLWTERTGKSPAAYYRRAQEVEEG
jgi:hypothetical protein